MLYNKHLFLIIYIFFCGRGRYHFPWRENYYTFHICILFMKWTFFGFLSGVSCSFYQKYTFLILLNWDNFFFSTFLKNRITIGAPTTCKICLVFICIFDLALIHKVKSLRREHKQCVVVCSTWTGFEPVNSGLAPPPALTIAAII